MKQHRPVMNNFWVILSPALFNKTTNSLYQDILVSFTETDITDIKNKLWGSL